MNEYRCPCGYVAKGSLAGILDASEAHRAVCPRNQPTPATDALADAVHIDPDCRGDKHPACPGWTFDEQHDRPTPCECACHDPHAHQEQR